MAIYHNSLRLYNKNKLLLLFLYNFVLFFIGNIINIVYVHYSRMDSINLNRAFPPS